MSDHCTHAHRVANHAVAVRGLGTPACPRRVLHIGVVAVSCARRELSDGPDGHSGPYQWRPRQPRPARRAQGPSASAVTPSAAGASHARGWCPAHPVRRRCRGCSPAAPGVLLMLLLLSGTRRRPRASRGVELRIRSQLLTPSHPPLDANSCNVIARYDSVGPTGSGCQTFARTCASTRKRRYIARFGEPLEHVVGNHSAASHSSACGRSRVTTNSPASARNASWSAVNGGIGRPGAVETRSMPLRAALVSDCRHASTAATVAAAGVSRPRRRPPAT